LVHSCAFVYVALLFLSSEQDNLKFQEQERNDYICPVFDHLLYSIILKKRRKSRKEESQEKKKVKVLKASVFVSSAASDK